MIVVCDTSPLLNLEAIRRLDLLPAVHGRVVPQAVLDELSELEGTAARWLAHSWIEVRAVRDGNLVEVLEASLDRGEAEAIVLGVELKADILLIDETAGRLEAQKRGLKVIGLVGTILMAKHRGIIPAVEPVLEALRTQAGFWLSDTIYHRALEAAGER